MTKLIEDFISEEEYPECAEAIRSYEKEMEAILQKAFADEGLGRPAKGLLVSSVLVNMLNILHMNLARNDFNLSLSSMLRSLGIENWAQTRYN